jgi:hypothetical protein
MPDHVSARMPGVEAGSGSMQGTDTGARTSETLRVPHAAWPGSHWLSDLAYVHMLEGTIARQHGMYSPAQVHDFPL